MNTLSFDELRGMFQNGTIWTNGYELYWYEHAWEILSRQGKADYSNSREYYEVWLRAVSLVRVYDQFSEIVFDEGRDPYYLDFIDDHVPMVVVGQILGGMIGKDEIYEEEDEALLCVLDTLKYDVFHSLRAEMHEADVFAWMLCTGTSSYFDEGTEINCLEDYEKAVTSAEDAVMNDWCVGHAVDAFDYVCRLMRD